MPQAHSTRSRLGLLTRRTGFRAHLPVHCRLFVMVPFLFLLIMVQVNAAQVQTGNEQSPPSNHPPIVVNPEGPRPPKAGNPTGSGSGPVQYCSACRIPKGYSPTKSDPDQLCVNKKVPCTCGSPPVKSDQEMCLYVLIPHPSVRAPISSPR